MGISLKSTTGKLLASAGLVAAAAAVAGMGTYGGFTNSTTPADAKVSTGTVKIDLSMPDPTNAWTLPISGLVPGDTIERLVTVANSGSEDLSAITMTMTATQSSALTSDPTNGLQVKVERCKTAWGGGPGAYTCPNGADSAFTGPIIGTDRPLNNMLALTHGGVDNLKFTTTLPTTAGNEFQGLTSTVRVQFTATQRAAANK